MTKPPVELIETIERLTNEGKIHWKEDAANTYYADIESWRVCVSENKLSLWFIPTAKVTTVFSGNNWLFRFVARSVESRLYEKNIQVAEAFVQQFKTN